MRTTASESVSSSRPPTKRDRSRRLRAAAAQPARLLSLSMADALYGIPATTLRDLIARGHLATVRLPGTRRIWLERDVLETFIRENRSGGEQ